MSGDFNLEQEAEYVLGMMDMYQSDTEVASLLKMKGLSNEQVVRVMAFIKEEGYRKRVRQAIKITIIGVLISVSCGLGWFIMFNANISSADSDDMSELVIRPYAKAIVGMAFYSFLFGIGQTLFGVYRYFNYSIKLRKYKTYI